MNRKGLTSRSRTGQSLRRTWTAGPRLVPRGTITHTWCAMKALADMGGDDQFVKLSTRTLAPGKTATYSTATMYPWETPPGHVVVRGQGYLEP